MFQLLMNSIDQEDNIKMRKPTEEEIERYNWQEIQNFWKMLKLRHASKMISSRDFMMLTLLIWYGRRANEILQLRVQDVDFDKQTIYFRQLKKRKKSEMIKAAHIMDVVKPYLEKYVAYCKYMNQHWLFESPQNTEKYMTRRNMDHIVAKYTSMFFKKSDGSPMVLWPHFFREILTNWVIVTTGDIDLAFNFFGHNDPKTTLRYRRPNVKEIRNKMPDLLK